MVEMVVRSVGVRKDRICSINSEGRDVKKHFSLAEFPVCNLAAKHFYSIVYEVEERSCPSGI